MRLLRCPRRAIARLGLIAVFCLAPLSACASSYEAYLGEMVPWPMMTTGIRGRALEVQTIPSESVVLPENLPDVTYGYLELGSGMDSGVTCVFWEQDEGAPLILVDANNDNDLSNDNWLSYDERTDLNEYNWLFDVIVQFDSNGIVSRVPYHLLLQATFSYELDEFEWRYGGYCHRRGLLSIEGTDYLIAVTSLLTTGGYEDPSTLVVAVDIDRDGQLDTLPFSHELFGPGEPLDLPTGQYKIVWTNTVGTRLEVERVGEPSDRPIIERGVLAPEFLVRSTSGDLLGPTDNEGRTTLLLFAGSSIGNIGECASCSEPATFSMPTRAYDILDLIKQWGDQVRLLVITDLPLPSELEEPAAPLYVVYAPDVVDLYRRHTGLVIVAPNGEIVELDRGWYQLVNGRPVWDVYYLQDWEIDAIVRRIIAERV